MLWWDSYNYISPLSTLVCLVNIAPYLPTQDSIIVLLYRPVKKLETSLQVLYKIAFVKVKSLIDASKSSNTILLFLKFNNNSIYTGNVVRKLNPFLICTKSYTESVQKYLHASNSPNIFHIKLQFSKKLSWS